MVKPVVIRWFALLMTGMFCTAAWAAAGDVQWEDAVNMGFYNPGPESLIKGSMATVGNTLYVASRYRYNASPGSNANIHVRALDRRTGGVLWETIWAPSNRDDVGVGLVARGRTVVVAGWTGWNDISRYYVVQAFDGHDGQVTWQDSCGPNSASRAPTTAIARDGNIVYVSGNCADAAGHIGIVRAYHIRSGALAWQLSTTDPTTDLKVANGQVYVTTLDGSGNLQLLAIDESTGVLNWQTLVEPTAGLRGIQSRLAADGGSVYLSWEGSDNSTVYRAIAAYNAVTGIQSWQSVPDDSVEDMVIDSGMLLVAETGNQALMAAYDASSGVLLWQDSPNNSETTFAGRAIVAGGGKIYLAGSAYTPAVESVPNFLVRAYSLNGSLLWQDNRPTTAQMNASATDIITSGKSIIAGGVSGSPEPPFGTLETLIRAYDVHGYRHYGKTASRQCRSDHRLVGRGHWNHHNYWTHRDDWSQSKSDW